MARRVVLLIIRLVLRRDELGLDPLLIESLDPLHEVLGVRLQGCIVALHCTAVEGVDGIARTKVWGRFHPRWRRPRAGPEADVGLDCLRRLDVRDELLLVPSNREAGHRGVAAAGHLVVGVALHGVVAGTYRDAPPGEMAAIGAEK